MRFVTEHRRHLLPRLPRLFPRIEPLVPALFLETIVLQASTIPEISDEYLLYVWQPSDGGSPIALAYGVSGYGPRTAAPILAALHRNPATADVGAVAVPRYNAALERGSLILPEIDCADSSAFRHGLQPTWLDLAYLLQTDLPYGRRICATETQCGAGALATRRDPSSHATRLGAIPRNCCA